MRKRDGWLLLFMLLLVGFAVWHIRFVFFPPNPFRLEIVQTVGKRGSEPGQFQEPMDLAIDDEGFLYVADSRNHRIQKFRSDGGFIGVWGGQGSAEGEFEMPVGIAMGQNGHLYVSDYQLDRIQVFDSEGEYLFSWGSAGEDPGEFQAPAGIDSGPEGDIYVADFYNHRVQRFGADGKFVGFVGTSGRFWSGALHYPTDIFVDAVGNIFVADAYNYRIQKFLPEGRFCHKWGGPFGWGIPGRWLGWFRVPSGIAVGPKGTMVVADSANHRVVFLDPNGVPLQSWPLPESDRLKMYSPTRVVIGPEERIYVVDTAHDQIIVLKSVERGSL